MRRQFISFRFIGLGLALGTTSLFALGAALSAQDVDSRWLPWLGCWEPSEAEAGSDLLCVLPTTTESGAVEVLRVVESEVVAREMVWADGTPHQTEREGCEGWEEGTFSADGRRVFMRSEHTCEGGALQEGGGIMAMSTPNEWLDIRIMGLEGENMAFVQRYRPASAQTTADAGFADALAGREWTSRSARMLASASLDVDDVIEASAQVPAEAVQALLAERGDVLDLDTDRLMRMVDAGVPEEVIDLAIAVSFPQRFSVEGGSAQMAQAEGGQRAYRPMMGAFMYDPFYSGLSLRYGYGYGYNYGFNSYGYGYPYYGPGYGGYGAYGGYGYRPTVVTVDRAPRDHGRVVRGRGYRSGGSSSSGAGASRGSAATRRSGGVSSGGSRSSGVKSKGRTAKRRGGGI